MAYEAFWDNFIIGIIDLNILVAILYTITILFTVLFGSYFFINHNVELWRGL